jgi:hypothetical protein
LSNAFAATRARLGPASIGAALTALALLIAFLDALTGINAPFAGGHFASSAGIGVCADNMWRLHTVLPVLGYVDAGATAASYYMHHPLGVFWTVALLGKLFGFHNWVLRLPPLLYVTLTPWFLARLAKQVWGPIAAGLTAVAFVALPITLGYASYHDLEQPVMFGCVVATWGYARFVETGRDRYALASAAGFFFAVNHDWQGYIWGALFLGWLFFRGFVLPSSVLDPGRPRGFGRYWALLAIAGAAALGIEVLALQESGRLADLLGSGSARTGGNAAPLALVLAARQFRIELMFTGLGIFLGKLAVPVIVARGAVKRNELEWLALPLLIAAVIQYVVFKQGADVHIFWPHAFAAYFALAVGALAATASDLTAWAAARLAKRAQARGAPEPTAARRARRLAPWAGLVLIGLPTLFVLQDGLRTVRLAHETAGRFAEGNQELRVDVVQALRWFRPRVPPASSVAYHTSVQVSWALWWEMRPASSLVNQPVAAISPEARTFILDTRGTSVAELRAAASRYHVHAVQHFWLIDPKEPPAPLSGYSFDEHEPSFLEGLSQGRVEPIRRVVEDPFVTWEARAMLGLPATRPTIEPRTAEQLRIAHNAAVAAGDAGAALRWRAALAARLDLPVHAKFDNKTELVGAIRDRGAQRSFTYELLSGTFKTDCKLVVRAAVVAPPVLSTLPKDTIELDLGSPPTWPTSLWKPGWIYSYKVVFRARPGTEQLTGSWLCDVRRTDGPPQIDLGRF